MTAKIENFESFTDFDWCLFDVLYDQFEKTHWDADNHAIDVEGNVLGQGQLWERLGGSVKPFHADRMLAIGYSDPGPEAGFTFTGNAVEPWGDWR